MFENVYKNPDAKSEEGKAEILMETLYKYYLHHIELLPDELKKRWSLHAGRSLILPFCQEPRFLACMRKNDGISAGEAKNSSPALKGTQ